jgi:hypothetical protein
MGREALVATKTSPEGYNKKLSDTEDNMDNQWGERP